MPMLSLSLSLSLALFLSFLLRFVAAQLPLPSPPFLPPDPSAGAVASNASSIPNSQWSVLLADLLYFYDAQRSGKLPAGFRVTWRNDSALSDGSDVGLDLTGGYYDAGDYIKATYPLSFALMSACWGAMEYGKGYDLSNQTAYLDSVLRWGLDWMIKAHPSSNTLYVLVGDESIDNGYWGGDQNIATPRPSYAINDTHPGTDAAASASAAFSACAALYAGQTFSGPLSSVASLQNSTYSSILLQHSQELYSFAVNATGGMQVYQKAVPQVAAAYGSSGYGDDLAIAALFLSMATNSSNYYNQALNYYRQFGLSNYNKVYNWDSKTPGVYVLAAELGSSRPNLGIDVSMWQKESEGYLDPIVGNSSDAFLTHGGLLYYDGDSDAASLDPAMNVAMLMSFYSSVATSQQKSWAYTTFANGQWNYALGNNPMNVPYIVGINPNSPKNPQSAMASGGNDISNIDNDPPQEAYVLYGALVGGPDVHDRYFDIRSDWPETEPALDYNAPILALAALHTMNDSSDPFYTRLQVGAYVKPQGTPCDAAFSCGSNGLSRAAKIAIGVICTIVGLLLLCALFYLWRKRKGKGKRTCWSAY